MFYQIKQQRKSASEMNMLFLQIIQEDTEVNSSSKSQNILKVTSVQSNTKTISCGRIRWDINIFYVFVSSLSLPKCKRISFLTWTCLIPLFSPKHSLYLSHDDLSKLKWDHLILRLWYISTLRWRPNSLRYDRTVNLHWVIINL